MDWQVVRNQTDALREIPVRELSLQPTRILVLRGQLLARGYSYNTFAKERGYNPMTVRSTVTRYWGTDQEPRSRLGYRIIQEIEQIISTPLPADLSEQIVANG